MILLGACAGVAYVTGYTIVGLEVDDDTRGRTFAFLQSAIRVILFAVIAIAPFLAAGLSALVRAVTGASGCKIANVSYDTVGYNLVLLLRGRRGRGARRCLLPADGRPAAACRCATTCPRRSAASRSRRCPAHRTAHRARPPRAC